MNMDNNKKKTYQLSGEEKQQIMQRLASFMDNQDEVVFAYAYGSFTEDIPFHDIDVGVYVSDINKEDASSYALDLSRMLGTELKIQADVRVVNFAPVSFLYYVIRGHLISDRDEDTRVQIVEDTIRRYLDIKPLIHRSTREAFAV